VVDEVDVVDTATEDAADAGAADGRSRGSGSMTGRQALGLHASWHDPSVEQHSEQIVPPWCGQVAMSITS
jgi:hypothetical protein